MATTATEVCNLGLTLISEALVNSVDAPTTEREQLLQLHFPNVRDAELVKNGWVFAKHWAELQAATEQTLDPDRPYRFQLPNDCIQPIRPASAHWQLNGRDVYHNSDAALKIRYYRNSIAIPHWHPLFTQAVSASVCLRITDMRTQSGRKFRQLQDWYDDTLEQATISNAVVEPAREMYSDSASSYLNGRHGTDTHEGGFYEG